MFGYKSDRKGSALIVVVVAMVTLMLLGTALIGLSAAEVNHGIRNERVTQAHYISVAGAEGVARYFVANQEEAYIKTRIENIQNGIPEEFNDDFANGNYVVNVNSPQPGIMLVESTGEVMTDYRKVNTLVLSNLDPPASFGEYAIAAKTIIDAAGGAFQIEGNIMSNGPQALTNSQLSNISGMYEFDSDVAMPIVNYPFNFVGYTELPAVTASTTFSAGSNYTISSNAAGNAIDIGGNAELVFNTGSAGSVMNVHLQGGMRQTGNSGMTFLGSGKVNFFVDGSIRLTGGSWNQTAFAGDVVFFVPKDPPDDPDRTIVLSGNTSYNAHFIAPNVDMTYNGGGSNWFTGQVYVNYFNGHGNFKMEQDPIDNSDFQDYISWPWTPLFWQ